MLGSHYKVLLKTNKYNKCFWSLTKALELDKHIAASLHCTAETKHTIVKPLCSNKKYNKIREKDLKPFMRQRTKYAALLTYAYKALAAFY